MPLEKVVENPPIDEALKLISEMIRERQLVIVVGLCRVTYEGRASSKLRIGERVVIIKGDGTLLIHQPTGHKPVNWQPPGGIVVVRTEDGRLQISVYRRRPLERVIVEFEKVEAVLGGRLKDSATLEMYASEEDVKKAIVLRPDILGDNVRIIGSEIRLGDVGIVDLLAEDREGNLLIVEIKNERAGREAGLQLLRYVMYAKSHFKRPVKGVLVAPELSETLHKMLKRHGLKYVKLTPKKALKILEEHERKGLYNWI